MNEIHTERANPERILEESWLLFQQKGYRGVSVDEICLQCGLTKPTLYYYFEDKEDLFVQVLLHKLQGFHRAGEMPGTLMEKLQRTAVSILDSFQTEYSSLLRDREHLKRAENLKKIKDAFHAEFFQPLNEIIGSGIESGEIADQNPEMLTLAFLGIINNFIGRGKETETTNSVLASGLTDLFLKGAGSSRIIP
jgi:AcrR family transcriptional regulator